MNRGERFLDAFAAIERVLRHKAGAARDDRFYALVDLVAKKDPAIRHLAVDLKEYADLRNAIVHERRGGRLIAEPHEETVQRLEQIQRLLEAPPKLGEMFQGPIKRASPDDSVGSVARIMRDGDFSQIPVYGEAEAFVGLLTGETVTRWLAAMLASGIGLVEEVPVAEVLAHTEDPEHHCCFLARAATAFDALEAFDTCRTHGWRLDAILITHGGRPSETPLGIITTFDIPRLFEAAGGPSTGL